MSRPRAAIGSRAFRRTFASTRAAVQAKLEGLEDPATRERMLVRFRAISLALDGYSLQEAARAAGCSRSSLQTWLDAIREKNSLNGIFCIPARQGRRSRIPHEARGELAERVRDKTLPGEPMTRDWLRTRFGVSVSRTTAYRLLHTAGAVFPMPFDREAYWRREPPLPRCQQFDFELGWGRADPPRSEAGEVEIDSSLPTYELALALWQRERERRERERRERAQLEDDFEDEAGEEEEEEAAGTAEKEREERLAFWGRVERRAWRAAFKRSV